MDTHLYIGPASAPDRYRLRKSIGRGGEAVLYLAEIELDGEPEPVVVKVMDTQRTLTPDEFERVSGRWSEQAELLRFVRRLGVVGVREHFEGLPAHLAGRAGDPPGRALCLVMNHVEGLDIRDWRTDRTLESAAERREAMQYVEQLADVLDWLHSGRATPSGRVVVHGDISPGNVMIDTNGQATLVDFGLSKLTATHRTTEVWHTPGFAAPEVHEGHRTTATDRYAFGAVTYFLLSGTLPAGTPEQLRQQFLDLPLLAGLEPDHAADILAVFATDPDERPSSLSAWARLLRTAVLSTTSRPARPVTAAAPPPPIQPPSVPPVPTEPPGTGGSAPSGSSAPSDGPDHPATQPDAASTSAVPGVHSAPTQPATPPTPAPPAHLVTSQPTPPDGPQPRSRFRRGLLVAALLIAVALVAGIGTYTAVTLTGDADQPRDDARTGRTAPPSSASPGPDEPTADPSGSILPPNTPSGPDGGESGGPGGGGPGSSDQDTLSLSQLEPIETSDDGFTQSAVTLNTKSYNDALITQVCSGSVVTEYPLNREWKTLRFTAGITDTSPNYPVRLTVEVDEEQKATQVLKLGRTHAMEIDVSKALRVTLIAVEAGSCSTDTQLALAEPTLHK
ncbi:serine/threonine protein kinase [Streptomyces sp. Da 82-17]|uniref:serine/threonine protein kinase n=1 Tax=Streptomyces sp. Da 82-17 TaxID=3377116 RepID=UPI0038D3CC7D